jgi:hypothetical protein
MSGQRTTARGRERLRDDLSGRDLAIISQVAELRLMSTRQIEAIHFPATDHASALSAARTARRVLEQLTRDRLLRRIDRRLGGIRGGSSSYIYGIGQVGYRIVTWDRPRPRPYREPGRLFTDHTLAIADVVVGLTLSARAARCELLTCQVEPRCWRQYSGLGGLQLLRPDLYAVLGVGDFEELFFIEVDRGTEHLPAVIRKCAQYDAYYRSGTEQDRQGVFPKVCLIVPDSERARRLTDAITADRRLEAALFVVTTAERAMETLIGANS